MGAGKRLVAKKKMDGWMNRNENTFISLLISARESGSDHQRSSEKIKHKIKCEDGKRFV